MKRCYRPFILTVTTLLLGAALVVAGISMGERAAAGAGADPVVQTFPDDTGEFSTLNINGALDRNNPFFQSLGTNGRACVTCHQPADAWSITPRHLRERFDATDGLDPVFRPNDGSNSPEADVSTMEARRSAYSMLLTKGLIRVGIGIPENAEFTLAEADDPYGYASAKELSLFRRPLPGTNLRFLSAVMWDGRETLAGTSLEENLISQAQDATQGHAQADHPLTREQLQQIVAVETGLFTAQSSDHRAGPLDVRGGLGGPRRLWAQPFYPGINDPLGQNPTGAPFDPEAFTLYHRWAELRGGRDGTRAARRSVARGEQLFNTRQFVVSGVKGVNDALGQPTLTATCTTCHDAPNAGDHSVRLPLDLGLTDASRRTPDLPLYTLRNKVTGETVQTSDPGRALISGKWGDIGKFKGPILRGLAGRPPYFHNGSAATLGDVVDFYDTRFDIGFTSQEKADLAAFLRSL